MIDPITGNESHDEIVKKVPLNPPGGLRKGVGPTVIVRFEAEVQVRRLDRPITEEDLADDGKREEIFEAALAGVTGNCEVWPNGIPYRIISEHSTDDVIDYNMEVSNG